MSAINKNEGKPRLSLVIKDFSNAIHALARLRENNLNKYPRNNWAESIGTPDAERFLDDNLESIERHVGELWKGIELDPENGDHHATAIMCRVCFILEYYYRSKAQREIKPSEPVKKTKYDWSQIPKEMNWCATDMNGSVFGYEDKPSMLNVRFHHATTKGFFLLNYQAPYYPWYDSLEERPKEQEPVKKTIYNWSDVPKICNWIAKDANGHFYAYESKPIKCRNYWQDTQDGICRRVQQKTNINWDESLEERPK